VEINMWTSTHEDQHGVGCVFWLERCNGTRQGDLRNPPCAYCSVDNVPLAAVLRSESIPLPLVAVLSRLSYMSALKPA
jgi:hypothetical protein